MERDQQKVTAASIERVQYIVKGDWLLQAACVCVCVWVPVFVVVAVVQFCFYTVVCYWFTIYAIDLPSIYLFYMFLVEGT